MIKMELTLIFVILISYTLALFGINNQIQLFLVSTALLALFYFFLSVFLMNGIGFKKMFKRSSYKNLKVYDYLIPVVAGFVFWACTFGIVFKLQNYPGKGTMLSFGGTGLLVILFLIALIYRFKQSKLLTRTIPFIVLTWGLLLIPGKTLYRILPTDTERPKPPEEQRDYRVPDEKDEGEPGYIKLSNYP